MPFAIGSSVCGGTWLYSARLAAIHLVSALVFLAPYQAMAQAAPPDAGSLLRQIEQLPKPLPQAQPPVAPPKTPPPRVSDELKVRVKGFRILGVTQPPADLLTERLARFIGKSMPLAELEEAIQIVVAAYREQGYVVRVFLPPQTIEDGVVDVMVIEGKLGRVLLDEGQGPARLSGERAAAYVRQGLPAGAIIKTEQLERNLLILSDLAGTKAAATLEPGPSQGDIDVRLLLTDTPLLSGAVGANNAGAIGTGANQLDAQLNVNGIAGVGEQWSLRGLGATGLSYGRVGLSLPVGYAGLTLGGNFATMRYHLGDRFASLDAKGSAQIAGLSAAYPIVRSRAQNLYASANVERRRYLNDSLGKPLSDKRVDALTLGLAGNSYDSGGATSYGLTLAGGRLDLSALAANLATDAASARTQGRYAKLSWNAARLQSMGDTVSVSAALAGQWADKNLDSSEKFFLGGPSGVRAYPANEAGGDEGFMLNLEGRLTLRPELQAIIFADAGSVQQNHQPWPGFGGAANLPNRVDLAGAGIGLNWSVWNSIARLSLAWRLGSNPLAGANGADSDGTRRIPRVWAQYNKFF